jgi:ABC-2 type transport system ATP-binding protein
LEEHNRGATILFSTHVMPQAEEICRHVVMVHQGRKVMDQALDNIRNQYDTGAIEYDPLDPDADVSGIEQLPGVECMDRSEFGYKIQLADNTDPAQAMHRIIDVQPPARIELSRPRLEDIFIRLVSTAADTAEDQEKLRANLVSTNGDAVS